MFILPAKSSELKGKWPTHSGIGSVLTFHLKMLKYTTGPSVWKSCRMLCVETMILQQDQMKYTIIYLNMLNSASVFTADVWAKDLKPLNKLKMHLHPNTLFLHTHFHVSKLYNI